MTTHPCAASRLPLKGAMPAARQSRFCGILGSYIARRNGSALGSETPLRLGFDASALRAPRRALLPMSFTSHASRQGGGHLTGMLRVEAVTNRRADGLSWRVLS
jgi:hypothetical protein